MTGNDTLTVRFRDIMKPKDAALEFKIKSSIRRDGKTPRENLLLSSTAPIQFTGAGNDSTTAPSAPATAPAITVPASKTPAGKAFKPQLATVTAFGLCAIYMLARRRKKRAN